MAEHTLKRFEEERDRLSATIREMGGLAESQLAQSLVGLREHDTEAAEQVIVDDARVDALDVAVQEQTVKLLALRQPMAVDLRVILSSIKIAAALERIADYAKNTAKRTIVLAQVNAPIAAGTRTRRPGRPRGARRSVRWEACHEQGQRDHDPPRHPDLVDQAARADCRGRDGVGRAAALQPRAIGLSRFGRL